MDLTHTIQPNSDQVNADDLMSGERTVTITGVEAGSSEQPVFVHLDEFPGRTYRPSKSMRRVMVAAWGKEASVYTGRRMTLYRDPEVTFGRDKVGGIKISAMSHIDKPLAIALTATRGKRALHKVAPLPDALQPQPEPTEADVAACTDTDVLRDMWQRSGDERRAQIMARKAELESVDTTTGEVIDDEPPTEEQS